MNHPLLLLHGALGSSEQVRHLGEAPGGGRRILCPDFPGHGARANGASPAGFGIDAFANDLIAILDREGIDTADAFGYSMGGYVALVVARRHPGRIGRIMTLGTKLAWDPATAGREAGRLDPDALETKAPAFADLLQRRHGEGWKVLLGATAGMMRELGGRPALTAADWPAISHRVLLGVGDRDAMVSVEETLAAARALPDGEFLAIPRTPHPIEQVGRGALEFHIRSFFGADGR